MRVLIIKTSSLGDIIHALPVLSYLHQAAPDSRIDWVVEESFQDLLSDNPFIDRLVAVAFKRWRISPFSPHTLREVRAFRKFLQEREYDLVFDIQGNTKSGLVCWLSNSKRKIGFNHNNLQEQLNALFTNQKVALHSDDRHATLGYLRIISAPFSFDPGVFTLKTDIHTDYEDDDAAGKLVSQSGGDPVILFHTGTTWQTKLWHENGWIALAREILTRYTNAAILLSWGNESEHETSLRIAEQVGSRVQVLERLSLKSFSALLKRVDVVVGGDTGPVHLAAAVGTATVSFYRCTDGSLNGPKGERHVIVQSQLACTKCLKKTCEHDEECIRSITPEMISLGVEKILLERHKVRCGQ
jgi:lipopolysaccharide heptosyltransferase I